MYIDIIYVIDNEGNTFDNNLPLCVTDPYSEVTIEVNEAGMKSYLLVDVETFETLPDRFANDDFIILVYATETSKPLKFTNAVYLTDLNDMDSEPDLKGKHIQTFGSADFIKLVDDKAPYRTVYKIDKTCASGSNKLDLDVSNDKKVMEADLSILSNDGYSIYKTMYKK